MFGLITKRKHNKLIERRDRDIDILLDEIEDLRAKMRILHTGELYQIPGYDKYFVDSTGSIFNRMKGYKRKNKPSLIYSLTSEGSKSRNFTLPKLIYCAFNGIDPDSTVGSGLAIKFRDGNRDNVSPENLYV